MWLQASSEKNRLTADIKRLSANNLSALRENDEVPAASSPPLAQPSQLHAARPVCARQMLSLLRAVAGTLQAEGRDITQLVPEDTSAALL